jgi:hypothetical protein
LLRGGDRAKAFEIGEMEATPGERDGVIGGSERFRYVERGIVRGVQRAVLEYRGQVVGRRSLYIRAFTVIRLRNRNHFRAGTYLANGDHTSKETMPPM